MAQSSTIIQLLTSKSLCLHWFFLIFTIVPHICAKVLALTFTLSLLFPIQIPSFILACLRVSNIKRSKTQGVSGKTSSGLRNPDETATI